MRLLSTSPLAALLLLVHAIACRGQTPLPRTGWTATADSQETSRANNVAGNALDGDTATFWHSKWSGTPTALPHYITIAFGATKTINGITYLPRQDGGSNGNIGKYEVRVSTDGTTFPTATVATGTWADSAALKTVAFTAVAAKAVRITALTEAGGRGPWSAAAEIDVLSSSGTGTGGGGGAIQPPLPRANWFAMADSAQGAGYAKPADPENPAVAVLDGDNTTIWHTQWQGRASPLPHTLTIVMGGGVNRVSGFMDGGATINGNVGQYEIRLSTDGTTFPTATVAKGTWPNTAAAKYVTFPAANAKAVRLTALTEAGGNGPWTSAAEVNVLGTVVTRPDSSAIGSWGELVKFPLVPVAAAMTTSGNVLTWSAYRNDAFAADRLAQTKTATFNPNTGAITEVTVTNTNHDMFCPGITMLGSGSIVVTGGDTSEKTSIYDQAAGWKPGPDMNIPRGYQSSTLTSTGKVFMLGGSWSGGTSAKNAEMFDPASDKWTLLSGIPASVILTNDPAGKYRADNHAWLFGWTGGSVFHAGPSVKMFWFDTTGSGSYKAAGTRPGPDSMNGNAVMYDAVKGKILTMGGGTAYQDAAAHASAAVITLTGMTATTKSVTAMKYARAYASAVVLPDGKTIVIGGQPLPVPFTDTDAVLVPEVWDPATEKFTAVAVGAAPRTYHSVAVLLQDGSVFSGGGGLCGKCDNNHFNGQIWRPPYLFNADDTPATRPTITVDKTIVVNGDPLTVRGNVALSSVVLVRYGTATHTVNTDQRRIELCGPVAGACSGTVNTRTIPADPGVAVAGPWMVFGLSSAGVPSLAKTVKIGAPTPATATALAAPTIVARSATPADATAGTAAPVANTFPATPANPAPPMPPGTQLE